MSVDGDPNGFEEHIAVPDGSIEVIRRLRGRSFWKGEQPTYFAAGMLSTPARLRFTGDASFVGLKIWPWAWNLIARTKAPNIVDIWLSLAEGAPELEFGADLSSSIERVAKQLRDLDNQDLPDAILRSCSVAELAKRTGWSRRSLQRWFKREVGVPPRTYLRLLRFQKTISAIGGYNGTLADYASRMGFADQAHMSREFRAISGALAGEFRSKSTGPFL